MEVSNTTGSDTQYRTASGAPKRRTWCIKPRQVMRVPEPSAYPFRIEFLVDGKVVLTHTCDKPLRRITLLRAARTGKYQVRQFEKPPQPSPLRTFPAGDGSRTSTRA